MSEFLLKFDLGAFHELDEFALLASQDYNYGGVNDWLGAFRGGLYGSYARIHGVVTHYYEVHTWASNPRSRAETEYHLASAFFNMDSAIECVTFALNALGYCAAPTSFKDVSESAAIRKISPYDILGKADANPPIPALGGYSMLFPSVQNYWTKNAKLLSTIFEQHDVSKHRGAIYIGGMARADPPPGFYESLGITDDAAQRAQFWPMKEIILKHEPKTPLVKRISQPRENIELFETLVPQFKNFISETGLLALRDARRNIKLQVNEFKND
ncbi:MAG: hypothetical protein OEV15_02915 [Gallionella sp.]|nr:hypothetical protein [Gallionella sp.]